MNITERMFKVISDTIHTLETEERRSDRVEDMLIELRDVREQAMEELNVR